MSKPPSRFPLFYSIHEVANHLGISDRTVRRWISAGDLHSHQFGSSIRIAEDDFKSFIAARRA